MRFLPFAFVVLSVVLSAAGHDNRHNGKNRLTPRPVNTAFVRPPGAYTRPSGYTQLRPKLPPNHHVGGPTCNGGHSAGAETCAEEFRTDNRAGSWNNETHPRRQQAPSSALTSPIARGCSSTSSEGALLDRMTQSQVEAVSKMVDLRSHARMRGDYELADSIRDEIVALSWENFTNDECLSNRGMMIDATIDSGAIESELGFSVANAGTVPGSLLPPNCQVQISDVPRAEGGMSTWKLVPLHPEPIERRPKDGEATVLQLAHMALGLASASSERHKEMDRAEMEELVRRAEARLELTGATELRGRKAADAAFWFALAGVIGSTDTQQRQLLPSAAPAAVHLLNSLTKICTDELSRFGSRNSCRPKDVLHVVERISAAGIVGDSVRRLYGVAADCLHAKLGEGTSGTLSLDRVVTSLRDGSYGLHSDGVLMGLWKFSTRQRKQRAFLTEAARHWERERGTAAGVIPDMADGEKMMSVFEIDGDVDISGASHTESDFPERTKIDWDSIFDDPTLPLVVDLGCGMGVSLLGLATLRNCDVVGHTDPHLADTPPPQSVTNNVDWSNCNFAGADLSHLAIGYAKGVTNRWGLDGQLQFFVTSAEDFVRQVKDTYPGKVELIMIQFPTPFRLEMKSTDDVVGGAKEDVEGGSPIAATAGGLGNSQLPANATSGFMVTESLLRLAYSALLSRHGSSGRLLLQSNCEDVAVHMRTTATQKVGFRAVVVETPPASSLPTEKTRFPVGRIPKRTVQWIAMGGERAEGDGWHSIGSSFLPRRGATETEVSCLLRGTPVHRCLLETGAEVWTISHES